MVRLIRSFHEDMKAELKINGEALEGEIAVSNGLRQGCTMAPTLFNMFFNLVVEVWHQQCKEDGVMILYKADGRLVGSRASKQDTSRWNELQFADNIAIMSTSKDGITHSMRKLFDVTSQWGLTISVPKTKVMVVGGGDVVQQPLQVGEIQLEVVSEFRYLGSILHHKGSNERNVEERIARASRAFGMLRKSIFQNKSLTTDTKRAVYKAVVLRTLLYGSETWTTKRVLTQKLETFHNRCLRGIFGITRMQQRAQHISSSEVRGKFGMKEMMEEVVMLRRMPWLGHVARMPHTRMPKQILFGRFVKTRPFHGVKMRWKDRVKKDMLSLNIWSGWYNEAQDRKKWYESYHAGMVDKLQKRLENEEEKRSFRRQTVLQSHVPDASLTCQQCHREFRRSGDMKRHKCDSIRSRKHRMIGHAAV